MHVMLNNLSTQSSIARSPAKNATACGQKETVCLCESYLSDEAFWRLEIEGIVLNESVPSLVYLQSLATLIFVTCFGRASNKICGMNFFSAPVIDIV